MHFGKAFMEEIGKGNAQIDWQLSKSKEEFRFESIDYKFFLLHQIFVVEQNTV